jgi:hypothetical protein
MKNQNKPYPVEDINTAIARLQGLKAHFEQHHLNDLFADDSTRFEQLSVVLEPIIFDFSKHRIDRTVVDSLVQWAQARDLTNWIKTYSQVQRLTILNSAQPCIGLYVYRNTINSIRLLPIRFMNNCKKCMHWSTKFTRANTVGRRVK